MRNREKSIQESSRRKNRLRFGRQSSGNRSRKGLYRVGTEKVCRRMPAGKRHFTRSRAVRPMWRGANVPEGEREFGGGVENWVPARQMLGITSHSSAPPPLLRPKN